VVAIYLAQTPVLGVKKPLFGQGSTRVYLKKIPKKFRRAEAAAVRVYKVN
jgi:hypothetical protein